MIFFFFFKQKTAYEMRISDWSSDVCSSDLRTALEHLAGIALPGVLFALVANQAAKQEHRQGNIRIYAEEEIVNMISHAALLARGRAPPASAGNRYRRNARAALPGCGRATPARCRQPPARTSQ